LVRYVDTVLSVDRLVSDDATPEEVLEPPELELVVVDVELLEPGGVGGVLIVELVPELSSEVLFVVFTLGGASTISSIGADKPKTVTLPTYTPGLSGALNLIGILTSEVVPLAPGGMMMLNV